MNLEFQVAQPTSLINVLETGEEAALESELVNPPPPAAGVSLCDRRLGQSRQCLN